MNFKKSFMAIAMSSLLSVGAVSAKDEVSVVDQAKGIVTDYVLPALSVATLVKGGIGLGFSFTNRDVEGCSLIYFNESFMPGFSGLTEEGKEGKVMNLVNIVVGVVGTAAGALNVVNLAKGE